MPNSLFSKYRPWSGYDEMFTAEGEVRPECKGLLDVFQQLDGDEFESRKSACDGYFLRQGITFNVYHDQQGTERIFPFDPVPRVLTSAEWEHLEAGLTQRIIALNLFLHDVYHDQRILNDGTIPRHYVENAQYYRKEFRGVEVPKIGRAHV